MTYPCLIVDDKTLLHSYPGGGKFHSYQEQRTYKTCTPCWVSTFSVDAFLSVRVQHSYPYFNHTWSEVSIKNICKNLKKKKKVQGARASRQLNTQRLLVKEEQNARTPHPLLTHLDSQVSSYTSFCHILYNNHNCVSLRYESPRSKSLEDQEIGSGLTHSQSYRGKTTGGLQQAGKLEGEVTLEI